MIIILTACVDFWQNVTHERVYTPSGAILAITIAQFSENLKIIYFFLQEAPQLVFDFNIPSCLSVAKSLMNFILAFSLCSVPKITVGRVAQSVWQLTGWTVRDRIPVGTRFSAHPDRPWGPPSLL